MFVVDTNVLLYAAEKNFAEHARCRDLLLSWRAQAAPWYLTWGILYEFVRVATHPRVFRKPWTAVDAWQFVSILLDSTSVGMLIETPRHASVASQVLDEVPLLAGNLLHDAHTAILMQEHGIRIIYTRDNDFHRFPFLEVRDPLAPNH
jgi:toxin-antitoxin system PIN domain toxin